MKTSWVYKWHATLGGLLMMLGICSLFIDCRGAKEDFLCAFMFLTLAKNNGLLWK